MNVMIEKVPKKLGQRERKHTTLVFGSKKRSQTIEESDDSVKDSATTKKGIFSKKNQPSRSNMENTHGHRTTRGQMNSHNKTMKIEPKKLLEEEEDSDYSINMETPEPPLW